VGLEQPCGASRVDAAELFDVNEIIFLVEEADEGGFVARALGASIFTEADDLEGIRDQIRDAVECHFNEGQKPKFIRLHFVRDEIIPA
jgi:hypothetical protein